MVPQYLSDLCTPVAEVPGRQRLRSADRGQLQTPRYRLTTYGGRSFTCAVPSIWNALPDYLKDTALSLSYFEKQLKNFLFSRLTSTSSAPEVVDDGALYKFTLYLLTLLTYTCLCLPSRSWYSFTDPGGM